MKPATDNRCGEFKRINGHGHTLNPLLIASPLRIGIYEQSISLTEWYYDPKRRCAHYSGYLIEPGPTQRVPHAGDAVQNIQ